MKYQQVVARNFAGHLRGKLRRILRQAVKSAVRDLNRPPVGGTQADQFEAAVHELTARFKGLLAWEESEVRSKKANYMPLFSMPPARRPRPAPKQSAPALTVVERRAVAAKRKVAEWKRKQKLAATKVAAYQKRVRYYTKKGVI